MKILHFGSALYQPSELAKGLRELGHDAHHAILDDYGYQWLIRDWDTNLEIDSIPPFLKGLRARLRVLPFFLDALRKYDVVHFHSYPSFFTSKKFQYFLDGRLLRLLGKKVYVSWWGCDLRRRWDDEPNQWSPCRVCAPELKQNCDNDFKTYMNRVSRGFSRLRFSNGGDLCAVNPDLVWLDNAIDTRVWRPIDLDDIPTEYRIQRTADVLIYHSFGNSELRGDVKGTNLIRRAVSDLQNEGLSVSFLFFDKVPNEKLLYYQSQADIAVDQLLAGYYGSTAVENMALGKPVVTYIRPQVLSIWPHEGLPVVQANPDNIKEVLRTLICNKELRLETGRRSREYATRVHDRLVVARKLLSFYMREDT